MTQPSEEIYRYSEEALRELECFLRETHHRLPARTWIETAAMHVYLRLSYRFLQGNALQCLDIATIEIHPNFRKQGLFSTFLTAAHDLHRYPVTYLEQVSNPVIVAWCQRSGWHQERDGSSLAFFLIKS